MVGGPKGLPKHCGGSSFPGLSPLSPLSPRPAAFQSPPCCHRLRVQQPLGHLPSALPAQRSRGVGTPAVGGDGTGGQVSGPLCHNHTALPCHSRCQDTAMSTTTEHFKPLWLPDGRSLLPRRVCQPGSGYLQEGSRSCFHTGVARPQGPPKLSNEHSTRSHRTGPAQPGRGLGVSIPEPAATPGDFGGVGDPLPCITHPKMQGDR